MKHIDWGYLRRALLFLLAAAAFSGSLSAGGRYFERRMEEACRRDETRLAAVSRRYLTRDEDESLIKEYFPQFQALRKTGVLGRERRLNWIETLQDARDSLKLSALGYEIAAQKPYTPDFPIALGKYRIFASEMNLDMQLRHEGNLFALLTLLDERAIGRYSVSRCELNRNFRGKAGPSAAGAGNVAASCALQWFSIKLADGSEIGP